MRALGVSFIDCQKMKAYFRQLERDMIGDLLKKTTLVGPQEVRECKVTLLFTDLGATYHPAHRLPDLKSGQYQSRGSARDLLANHDQSPSCK